MKKLIISALVLGFASTNIWATEIKGNPEELRQFLHPQGNVVTIQGNAEKTAYTDKAVIDLVVTTEDKLLSDSLVKNSQLRAKITAELIKNGVKSDDIKSAKFSSTPEYGYFGKKAKSYMVNNRMSITITDEKQLENIAVLADKHDEVELSSSRFEHSKKEQFEEEVKIQALEKVMASKASYEKMLGVKLVPIGINNLYIGSNATQGAAFFQNQERMTSADMVASAPMTKQSVTAVAPPAASFDEIQYMANIYVNFQVITGTQE